MDVQIPPGLTELMQDFTVAALRERPSDIVDFAADYFVKLKDSKKQYGSGGVKPKGVQFTADSNSDGSSDEEPGWFLYNISLFFFYLKRSFNLFSIDFGAFKNFKKIGM